MSKKNELSGELTLKSLFRVLSADASQKLFDRKSIRSAAKEMGATREDIKQWYAEWSSDPELKICPAERQDCFSLSAFIALFLMLEDSIDDSALEKLSALCNGMLVPYENILSAIKNRNSYISGDPLEVRHSAVLKHIIPRRQKEKNSDGRDPFYIANHITYEGLDELQRLLIAHSLGIHAAIDGPPGTGKTQSVIKAAEILGLNLYTKTCSSRTVESHIISYPVLTVREGASVTGHVNGPLVMAMEGPGIFYGDEFNLLKEDVQKRLNSAFDDRRSIDRNDGAQIKAKPGFWGVISYNPSENMVSRDLEDSVADRFIHLHYGRWSPDFKAYVSSCRAKGIQPQMSGDEKAFDITLGWRGITGRDKFFIGEEKNGRILWKDFFSGAQAAVEPEFIYRAFDQTSVYRDMDAKKIAALDTLAKSAFGESDLARMISRFTDLLHSLAQTGQSPLLEKIGMKKLIEDEDFELLSIHQSSARIEIAALLHYQYLVSKGFNRYLAQSYAVKLIIDQVCYGQYRERKLRNDPVHKIVTQIAKGMQLLAENQSYNTKMITESLLKR